MVNKKIVCLGGGTGTSVVLSGLKKYPVDLSAIVSMADDGGSNRVIRDEFGLLPTSDIRQCFVALAENASASEQSLRKLFTYRFHEGQGFEGMTFGNLFMVALTDIFGSQTEAIKKTSEILKIKGKILPITLTDSKLVAVYENGEKVIGEHLIDEPKHNGRLKITNLFLEPPSQAYPEAVEAILNSNIVVIGPGDLYTSLISGLVVKGIGEALMSTQAKVVYVLNLMTKYGQTTGFTARNHIEILEKYLGIGCLDYVVINSSPIPQVALKKYEEAKEFIVQDDLKEDYYKIIRSDILSQKEAKEIPGDILKRSFIRHDSDKLAKVIMENI
jgi:uncharacterized cofD-like protein